MKTKKFLSGLAVGTLVGSVLGLFISPDKGKKNRENFRKMSKKVSQRLMTEAAKVSKLGKKEYEAIVENVIKKYSKDDLLNKQAWEEIAEELKGRWTEVRRELKKTKPTSSTKKSGK